MFANFRGIPRPRNPLLIKKVAGYKKNILFLPLGKGGFREKMRYRYLICRSSRGRPETRRMSGGSWTRNQYLPSRKEDNPGCGSKSRTRRWRRGRQSGIVPPRSYESPLCHFCVTYLHYSVQIMQTVGTVQTTPFSC